jgi:hypothetical protein
MTRGGYQSAPAQTNGRQRGPSYKILDQDPPSYEGGRGVGSFCIGCLFLAKTLFHMTREGYLSAPVQRSDRTNRHSCKILDQGSLSYDEGRGGSGGPKRPLHRILDQNSLIRDGRNPFVYKPLETSPEHRYTKLYSRDVSDNLVPCM